LKGNATDNTCFGHNAEFAWLLLHSLEILGIDARSNIEDAFAQLPSRTACDRTISPESHPAVASWMDLFRTIYDHTVSNGIDEEFGGVFVEGPHAGGVYELFRCFVPLILFYPSGLALIFRYDREKEFWQQAEVRFYPTLQFTYLHWNLLNFRF
jgi:mannobiose 2-epimerase